MDNFFPNEYRCECGKLLFKGIVFNSNVEIKCARCKKLVKIQGLDNIVKRSDSYAIIINSGGVIKNASSSVTEHLHYFPDELIGKSIYEINITSAEGFYDRIINDPIKDVFYHYDALHKNKEGEILPAKISFKIFQNNNEKFVLAIANRNFSNNANYFEGTASHFSSICDFYNEFDKDGNLNYVSLEGENLMGWGQKFALGKPFLFFVSETCDKYVVSNSLAFISQKKPFRIQDVKLKCRDGRIVTCEIFFNPKFDELGNYLGYAVMSWLDKGC